ncbi:hypothetical protein [Agrococcus casei]|uniref:DNA-binding protein n=1 Tax=Agrococcus casei LMG 22410 TaxID=1255656 RepID=A0A1R4GLY9_9MICO|nr:hypothetical protein [Agrococcus casei]SJM69179.1 hypothetical protein CZ674_13095 [Agrococcus casei LMG 22410]
MSTRDAPEQIGGLPRIGRPATSALLHEGITTLAEAANYGKKRLGNLHGVGPKALRILSDALDDAGLSWTE